MERQVALALVALCALLGCAYTCEFEERVSVSPEPLLLASALQRVGDSNPDACRARCCERQGCDAAVLALPQDGPAQCFLLNCGGACTLLENKSGQYRVFTRSDAHAPDNTLRVMPLMLQPSTRPEDQKNSTNVTTDVCALPPLVGLCKAALPRFYFDSKTGSCSPFIYGGCGSNGNNFDSQQECEKACPRVKETKGESPQPKAARMAPPLQSDLSEDVSEESEEKPETKEMTQDEYSELCLAPPVVGPCRAAFPRWFYNASSGRCEMFIYGGCNGNKNNHDQEETCSSSCAQVKVLASKKEVPEMSEEYKSQCVVAPESGPCRAAFSMYYFDLQTQSCKTFIYGGCRGNNNRYGSEQECSERCTQIESNEGHTRNRWTAAFLLFLALATISFLLLMALVFITLRRNRSPRRTLSIRSDKQELLPDSERSSMDSLPLPESPNKV